MRRIFFSIDGVRALTRSGWGAGKGDAAPFVVFPLVRRPCEPPLDTELGAFVWPWEVIEGAVVVKFCFPYAAMISLKSYVEGSRLNRRIVDMFELMKADMRFSATPCC